MSGRDDLRDFENEPGADPYDVVAVSADTVKRKPVRWLWRGWVPLKMVALLIGLPGQGKTTLAEWLAAAVTLGELDGDLLGRPSHVLIVSYEDQWEETLRPRLEAAGADLKLVDFLARRDRGRVLDLTSQVPGIERVARAKEAKLLVIDPLVAGLPSGSVNSHKDQDVRGALAPIAMLAGRCELAVLSTGHFSKSAASALVGMGGSVGFSAAARSILVFGVDPKDEQGAHGPARVLAHAKCNVGRLQRSRQCRVLTHVLDPFGDNIETNRFEFGEPCDVSADDLLRVDERRRSALVEAKDFLLGLLADGPHRAGEVFELADAQDISAKTLKRAKAKLKVKSEQRKDSEGKPEWWWKLPEKQAEEAE
jgi:RecA-family ATPase